MSGPPVVLVHGYATSSQRTWRDTGWLDLLADAGRDTHAIDLLGHGDAPKPHDPAAYDDVEALVLEAFPDEPVDAIGFSLGARTLLTIAANHPDRFNNLVLMGVGRNLFHHDADHGKAVRDGIAGSPDPENPEAMHFNALAESPEIDREALLAFMKRTDRPVAKEPLDAITCPVLVVLGSDDFAGPADPLLERLPHAQFTGIDGLDHFATPKDFRAIDAVLTFLDAQPF